MGLEEDHKLEDFDEVSFTLSRTEDSTRWTLTMFCDMGLSMENIAVALQYYLQEEFGKDIDIKQTETLN